MIDRDTVDHEANHAAAAILLGIEVTAVDAVGDGTTHAGQIKHIKTDDWQSLAKTLLAAGTPPGLPPNASRSNDTSGAYADVSHLNAIIREKSINVSTYYALKARTTEITSSPEFRSLKERIVSALLGNDGVLNEEDLNGVIRRWEWDTEQT